MHTPPTCFAAPQSIPVQAGVGLRPVHYQQILTERPAVGWFEVHSENYFGAGGQPLYYLERVRDGYPLSLHGVGLCLGSTGELDRIHLQHLDELVRRIEPGLVSEHLSWGRAGRRFLNDLLPLPYTEEAFAVVCDHIDEVQERLRRPILIENISSYVRFRHSTMPESEFIARLVRRTGCGILLDINNLYVNEANHGIEPRAYLDALPADAVWEIHLAGHDRAGGLLIDTHGTRVAEPVWALFRQAVERFGPIATLIEWDADIPAFEVLLEEAGKATTIMRNHDAFAA
ncbi:MNIO family bufferin maturase [Burkholderia sp. PU8-34]